MCERAQPVLLTFGGKGVWGDNGLRSINLRLFLCRPPATSYIHMCVGFPRRFTSFEFVGSPGLSGFRYSMEGQGS